MPAAPKLPARTRLWTALGLSLLAGACGDRPPSAELFPLDPGYRWTYRQTTLNEDDTRDTATLSMDTLPAEDFEGQRAYRRHSDDGLYYWLRRDATGVYRVAARHELEAEPKKDAAPRYVLKEPLVVGTEWQALTVPYLLRRQQGFPPELRNEGKTLMMRYAIEGLKDSVSVPAGRFDGCLRVKGTGSLKLYTDPVAGWRDVVLTTTEWYCPGPGLVKLVRDEPAKSPYLVGGSTMLELQDWHKP